jgi:hypothetical protein
LIPLVCGCLALAGSANPLVATLFMGLLGTTTGIGAVLMGALWPELYGTTHLGAIRAFATSAMVFGTGLSPAIMGFFIDRGVAMETIALASALYCLLASGLALFAVQAGRPRTALR